MRATPSTLGAVLVVTALGAASLADDPSCGTIDTAGAVIETGAAPTQGQIVEDPCAREEERPVIPELPPLGSIGTFTASPGTYVSPPDISPAVPGPFHATTGQTIPAGDHVFTTFTIDPGITVAVASGAEIWTTGDAVIQGELRFSGAGLLHCGGDLTILGGAQTARIETGGTNGPVDIQVGGSFRCGTHAEVVSARMGLLLETFGTPPASGNVLIEGPYWAIQDDVVVKASGGIRISGDNADVEADYGTVLLHAFGGDVLLDTYASIQPADSDDAPPCVIEAGGAIRLTGESEIQARNGCALRLTAFGGDVLVQESVVESWSETDESWIRAAGSVVVEGADGYVGLDGEGQASEVRAFGGAVEFMELEGEMNWSYIGGQTVTVSAATDVRLERVVLDAWADEGLEQNLFVLAHGGRIHADGRFRIDTREGRAGRVLLHASDGIALAGWAEAFIQAHGTGGLEAFAGMDGIDLDLPYIDAEHGNAVFLSEGRIALDTDVACAGDLRVISTHSWIDVPGRSLTTENVADGVPSGWVVVESWAGSAGRVDVSDATLRTGTSTTRSGDVVLRVVQAGGAAELDSYLLPKKVKTKLGRKDVADSLMTITGDLDLGTSGPDLTTPTTLRIGDRTFDLPGLTANAKGNKLTYRGGDLDAKLTTDKGGSSRGKFTFKLRGDPAGVGDPDGTLVLGLACGEMDARCAVAMHGGGFKRGKVRGAVVEPPVRLDKAKVTVKGAGKDKLLLKLGLTSGGTPDEAPDVVIGIGAGWSATVPGGLFARKKESYRFKGDADGLRKVTLDYGKETLTVSGKGLDLGPHVSDDGALRISVRVGDEELALRVKMRRKGGKHTY